MTEKEIIKKLAGKYTEIWGRYEKNNYEMDSKKLEAQIDLLDDIFEEFFGIENLYVDDKWLKSEGKKIG